MLLSEEEKTTAITHLVNTWNVLDNLEQAEHLPNDIENDNLGWYMVLYIIYCYRLGLMVIVERETTLIFFMIVYGDF